MNLNGYIKLHRKMLAWQWRSHPPTLCLFIHLLLKAAYEPQQAERGITLKPGQLIISRKTLVKDTGLSEMQIRTALSHLQKTGEILVSTYERCKASIVTIQNWPKYQEQPNNQPSYQPNVESPQSQAPQGFPATTDWDSNPNNNPMFSPRQRQPNNQPNLQPNNQPSYQPNVESPQSQAPQGFQVSENSDQPKEEPKDQPKEEPKDQPTIYKETKEVKKKRKKDIYSDQNGWPQFAEFVWMPQKEYDTYLKKYGKPFTDKAIEILSHYKGSSGKKYVSDYQALCGWVKDKVLKDYPRLAKPQPTATTTPPDDTEWGGSL